MIKTVADLRAHFPKQVKFFFYKAGLKQTNAMLEDKVDNWVVTDDFIVVVILK